MWPALNCVAENRQATQIKTLTSQLATERKKNEENSRGLQRLNAELQDARSRFVSEEEVRCRCRRCCWKLS